MTFLPGITKNIDQGAATSVICALIDDDQFKKNGGKYFKDCRVSYFNPSFHCNNGNDLKLQQDLWTLCDKLVSSKGYKYTH